jgi:hypothetical protein
LNQNQAPISCFDAFSSREADPVSFGSVIEFSGESARFARESGPLAAASIELEASLRYTGTRLRLGDEAFRSAAPRSRAAIGFTSNISKA